ncbi:topology modulation protein [Listeria valentina]|uniref:topology modulation protein n=1 Tax=Listeria valentina TaxID=2705293 RepID=UPI001431102D|nr:topology modulation protein [Listeria valentina]
MPKLNIIGPPGSGKSTLARKLGKAIQISPTHLDTLYFKPGWVETSKQELCEKVQQLILEKEDWIIEGNYTATWSMRFIEADLTVFLDLPRYTYFSRVLKRGLFNLGKVRPDSAPGCPERIDFSFYKYVLDYPKKRVDILERLAEIPDGKRIVLQSKLEIERFLIEYSESSS